MPAGQLLLDVRGLLKHFVDCIAGLLLSVQLLAQNGDTDLLVGRRRLCLQSLGNRRVNARHDEVNAGGNESNVSLVAERPLKIFDILTLKSSTCSRTATQEAAQKADCQSGLVPFVTVRRLVATL